MKTFHIIVFGCSRRGLDAARIKDYFIRNGLVETEKKSEADHLVVVTCGLTEAETAKVQKCVKEVENFNGELLVYGCLPAMDPLALEGSYSGKTVITKDIEKIDEIYNFPVKMTDVPDANVAMTHFDQIIVREDVPDEQPVVFKGKGLLKLARKLKWKTKKTLLDLKFDIISLFEKKYIENIPNGIGFDNSLFSIRVATGCAGNCSFCVIKKAIGKIKSKPFDEIKKEAELAISRKSYKVNLLSSDTGAYGVDMASNFPELLQTILDVDPKLKIAFVQDINPLWLCKYNDQMVELVKTKRIISLLSPIQSGSERLLKLMRRYNDIDKMIYTFNQLKKAWPGLKIRTQVIIGFPTETDDEFEMTIDMIKKCKFDEIDIFEYFEVKGSEAENIFPKVPPDVIKERMKKIKSTLKIPYRAVGSSKFKKYFRWYTKYD